MLAVSAARMGAGREMRFIPEAVHAPWAHWPSYPPLSSLSSADGCPARRHSQHLNRNPPWDERLHAIRATLPGLSLDLLGLQEVLRAQDAGLGEGQATAIAEGLGYHVAFGASWELGGVEFGNALLSRFPIVRQEVIALPFGVAVGTAQPEADEKRSLLFVELEAPFARIPVFITHLEWRMHQGHVREVQVREVVDRVKALAPLAGFPAILMGDFNAEPESDEIRFLKGQCSLRGKSVYFSDTFAHAGGGSPGYTYSRTNPYAATYREPERRLDYIFVRGPDKLGRGDPIEAARCFDRPVDGVFPSDHYGMMAVLSVA